MKIFEVSVVAKMNYRFKRSMACRVSIFEQNGWKSEMRS